MNQTSVRVGENHQRRVEIIRRAAMLNPPIRLNELLPLTNFKSSVCLSWPLSEVEWSLLKDRLRLELQRHSPNTQAPSPHLMSKASARCEEIVRRAALLNPPLTKEVLETLPAYQGARIIPWELMETEWPLLQSRLLSQLADQQAKDTLLVEKPQSRTEPPTKDHEATTAPCTLATDASAKRKQDEPTVRPDDAKKQKQVHAVQTEPPPLPTPDTSEGDGSDHTDPSITDIAVPMDIDTPQAVRNAVQELVDASISQSATLDPADTKAKIEYLAAKFEAIGRNVMPITQLPIEMRIVAVLVRALSEFKDRHHIEPRIDLVMQTLHTTEIKSLQAAHDLPCGICPASGFMASGGTGVTPTLAQSLLFLIIHYDGRHLPETSYTTVLEQGHTIIFLKSLIALPDQPSMVTKLQNLYRTGIVHLSILNIIAKALVTEPIYWTHVVAPNEASVLGRREEPMVKQEEVELARGNSERRRRTPLSDKPLPVSFALAAKIRKQIGLAEQQNSCQGRLLWSQLRSQKDQGAAAATSAARTNAVTTTAAVFGAISSLAGQGAGLGKPSGSLKESRYAPRGSMSMPQTSAFRVKESVLTGHGYGTPRGLDKVCDQIATKRKEAPSGAQQRSLRPRGNRTGNVHEPHYDSDSSDTEGREQDRPSTGSTSVSAVSKAEVRSAAAQEIARAPHPQPSQIQPPGYHFNVGGPGHPLPQTVHPMPYWYNTFRPETLLLYDAQGRAYTAVRHEPLYSPHAPYVAQSNMYPYLPAAYPRPAWS